jgi:hypothetical protein
MGDDAKKPKANTACRGLRLPAASHPMPPSFAFADWRPLLPGIAFWALALYLPLSLPLASLEERLSATGLAEGSQALVLVLCSLILALGAGLGAELGLGWALGPSWASSLGLVVALWSLFWALASRA